MNDKIKVPHEYLDTLRHIRAYTIKMGQGERTEVMDALIAAAEADAPLPEGWVLLRYSDGSHGVFYYPGHGAVLTRYDDGTGGELSIEHLHGRLTPLRPTVAEADVEKAARAARAIYLDGDNWDRAPQNIRDRWMNTVRAAIDALGIEVTS